MTPTAAVADVCEVNPTLRAKLAADDLVGFVGMADLDAEAATATDTEVRVFSDLKGYTPFERGDILVAKITPCFENRKTGQATTSTPVAFGSTEFHVLRPHNDAIDARYLLHFLRRDAFLKLGEMRMTGAGGQRRVPARIFAELVIPLPPLEEQRRIAAILDAADGLRTKRRQALAKLDTLTQAIFIDMFGDPVVNERGWERILAGEATTKIGSGATPRGGKVAYKESGISLIRSMNVHDGRFVWEGLAFIDDRQAAALSGVTVEPEDVLLNITGASVARVCLAPSAVLPARVNQHVAIVRPDTGVLHPKFLAALLLSPSMKALLLRVGGTGATREAITKGDIEVLDLVRPSLDLQLRFVEAVEGLVEIHHHGSDQSGQLDQLFASLQQRAFRGEL